MKIAALVIIILIILISFTIYYEFKNTNKISKKINNIDVFKMCQVPTLNMNQCYNNKFNKCPNINGSYDQCTNNYIPNPSEKNCPCMNRTFEMCPPSFKISEKCYNTYHQKKINENNDISVKKSFPRVNMWNGNINNDDFLIQSS
jgi:hypothetical protein